MSGAAVAERSRQTSKTSPSARLPDAGTSARRSAQLLYVYRGRQRKGLSDWAVHFPALLLRVYILMWGASFTCAC